jgi:hypothetical protein
MQDFRRLLFGGTDDAATGWPELSSHRRKLRKVD